MYIVNDEQGLSVVVWKKWSVESWFSEDIWEKVRKENNSESSRIMYKV